MTIEERVKLAEEKHHSGYNCAQAVLCSYSDKLGIDEETLFRLSEGFGAGMADMQGTCGAATGMYMIAGALGSSGAIEKGMTKGRTYQTVKGLTAAFDEKNGFDGYMAKPISAPQLRQQIAAILQKRIILL